MDTYASITVTRRGGLDAVSVVDRPLRDPAPGEARIRVLAAPVCRDDVAIRVGNRPFLRKPPYVPGYAFIGVDPVEAAPLILNYLVAQQVLHRVLQVERGESVLLIGASGGVGTAVLELGRLAGLRLYGTASPAKHAIVAEHGATPIDYRTGDLVAAVREHEPGGLDDVVNGMGPEYLGRGLALLRRGGVLVEYGAPQSIGALMALLGRMITTNLLPNGKKIIGYGTHRQGVASFKEDWATLFGLLQSGRIHPVITGTYPLLQATAAYAALESGTVTGSLVLTAGPART